MRVRKTLVVTAVVVGVLLVVAFIGCQGVVDPAANQELRSSLGNTSVTVFPVIIRTGDQGRYDPDAAKSIASAVDAERLATTRLSDAQVPISGRWHTNESRMYRETAAIFADYAKQHPIQTRYGLLAEYLCGGNGHIMGVHVYVVGGGGRLAGGYGLNSEHSEFRQVDPKTIADCTRLVVRTIGPELRRRSRS